jgi:hypothetical protein
MLQKCIPAATIEAAVNSRYSLLLAGRSPIVLDPELRKKWEDDIQSRYKGRAYKETALLDAEQHVRFKNLS